MLICFSKLRFLTSFSAIHKDVVNAATRRERVLPCLTCARDGSHLGLRRSQTDLKEME